MIYVVATTKVKPEGREAFIARRENLHRRDAQGEGLHLLRTPFQRERSEHPGVRRTLGDAGRSHRPQPRAASEGVA